ncbi:hypothetical protein CN613_25580 [Bacillus pseudomycoides]|uniref:HNH nuclease domain-containing protein n=1 Tax=Bacillus pseudomycoides TaxID=64104 RepID=A0A2A8BYJ2_9BACI|nr:hypothetical protein [Bacillus pseudomycoides]PEM65318.1 hypothetical protein CN613_25580 [Bacillus pseudomycoides]
MFDTTGLIEKKNKKGTLYFEDTSGNIVAKSCVSCKKILDLTLFSKNKKGLAGVTTDCKECQRNKREPRKEEIKKYQRKYRKNNPVKIQEIQRNHYHKNKEKIKEQRKKEYKANHNGVRTRSKEYYKTNRDAIIERSKDYYQNNKEKVKEYHKGYAKEYRIRNKEKIRMWEATYRRKNRKEITAKATQWRRDTGYDRIYYKRTRERRILLKNKRRAFVHELPFNLTDYSELLNKQESRCPLSGFTNTLHLEHFIPLSIGHGGTTFENCYYMDGSLNISKNAHNPFEWIKTQPIEYQDRFHSILVPMLAARNEMTVEEFTEYVYWCFDNPRTIEDLQEAAV